jgi:DNA helicase-2/ATP-dependent DNA helicase PcrA
MAPVGLVCIPKNRDFLGKIVEQYAKVRKNVKTLNYETAFELSMSSFVIQSKNGIIVSMTNAEVLNAEQQQAVKTTEGPVLVVAGAGAGKTKVIVERIVHIIQTGKATPSEILAVTFTNKAAEEMRERVLRRMGQSVEKPTIGTFHSLGALMVREKSSLVGLKKNFTILDEDDALRLIKESLLDLALDPKQYEPSRIRNIISTNKNRLVILADYLHDPEAADPKKNYFGSLVGKVWKLYEEKKRANNALDFDDLISYPVRLLIDSKDAQAEYQQRWKYIHVDEYQDTNDAQYVFSKLLAGTHRNIFVVGDIDQAIYSWRGADFRNILNFQKDYADAAIITLEENYRSTDIVLEAANAVIIRNKLRIKKNLRPNRHGTGKITVLYTEDEKKEGAMITRELLGLKRAGLLWKDIAVLYRTNAQSRALEEVFLERNIPYRIIGGVRFYERREIKDLIAYVRFLINPDDELSKKRILNVPTRGIGKVLALKIIGNISNLSPAEASKKSLFDNVISSLREKTKTLSPTEALKSIITAINYRPHIDDGTEKGMERWQNVQELMSVAQKMKTIEEFLEHVTLFAMDDSYSGDNDVVYLMTMHAAKGLEFEAVFVAGLEEGLFPHSLSLDPESIEEERRLYYVAITRAKTHLFLTLAARRMIFGERTSNIPSRFLKEIPEHLLEVRGLPQITEWEEDIIIE